MKILANLIEHFNQPLTQTQYVIVYLTIVLVLGVILAAFEITRRRRADRDFDRKLAIDKQIERERRDAADD